MSVRVAALRETVTLFARSESGTDRYGDPLEIEGEGFDVPAAVIPVSAVEDFVFSGDSGDRRRETYRIFVGPDAPVDGLSRVEWRGRSLEVMGEPLLEDGRNGPHHFEFDAREVLGG